ncbi:MAG: MarP family serine protease [Actinobacteria bacterium]|nr:MarP family serine protease [Actinomycetota bacterium]
MAAFLGFNLIDLVVLLFVGLAVAGGFRRGAALQLVTYAGLFLGLVLGALLAPKVANLADDQTIQAVIALGTFLTMAGVGDALGFVVGRRVWAVARASRLSKVDSIAGSVVAVVAVLLATWLIGLNLVSGPVPAVSKEIQQSALVRALDTVLPPPPSLLTQVRGFLNRFGFPEVFQGLPPAPAGPVEGPTKGETARAAEGALRSTVKIVGEACGAIQEGSGFVAAEGLIVTNAHVVSGVEEPNIQEQGGGTTPATTVLFDPDLDIAILRVTESPGPVLTLLRDEVDRGAGGAILGYPENGPLTRGSAAVRRALDVTGPNIYGVKEVRRRVYELQAQVRPGNSGGPFLLVSGDVAGVVFSASTTNNNIGYALRSQDVAVRVDRARDRTDEVDTGGCI